MVTTSRFFVDASISCADRFGAGAAFKTPMPRRGFALCTLFSAMARLPSSFRRRRSSHKRWFHTPDGITAAAIAPVPAALSAELPGQIAAMVWTMTFIRLLPARRGDFSVFCVQL